MEINLQLLIDERIEFISTQYKIEMGDNTYKLKSLAHGYPGLIILLSSYNNVYATDKYDKIIFSHVEMLIDLIRESQPDFSMFTGLTGIAFALREASKHESRYKKILTSVDNLLIKMIHRFLNHVNKDNNTAMSYYDVISGLSGVLRYLLLAVEVKQLNGLYNEFEEKKYGDVIQAVLHYLCNLSSFNNDLPGWYVPAKYLIDKDIYPGGVINDSFSHGSAGILAILSIAHLKGWNLPYVGESIATISCWFKKNIHYDSVGTYWPQKIHINSSDTIYKRGRDAWCYGVIGVARALYLAGKALGNNYYQELSIEAIKEVTGFYQTNGASLLELGFCHGTAGIVRVLGRTIQECKDIDLIKGYDHLYHFLFECFSKRTTPFLINGENELGLLEGPIGVCLTLLSHEKPELTWDYCFCIA